MFNTVQLGLHPWCLEVHMYSWEEKITTENKLKNIKKEYKFIIIKRKSSTYNILI